MNENKNTQERLQEYLEIIEKYATERTNTVNLADIINNGLNIFNNISDTMSASLFLLNDLTYEFEHRKTIPEDYSGQVIKYYTQLIDVGAIGNALETGKYVKIDKASEINFENDMLILPLIVTTSGVIGLVIILLNDNDSENSDLFDKIYKYYSIIAGLYAGTLENTILFRNLNKTQSLLEQRVAARTMNLAQSKRELQTIINTVQTGILLIDADSNKIINANPVASDVIGLKKDKIEGHAYTDFFPDEQKQLPPNKHSSSFESQIKSANGNKVPILRAVSLISIGNQKYRIESFLDITERKQAEIALQQTNELLELKVQERTIDLQLLVHKLKEEVTEREKAQKELLKLLEKEKELSDLKTRFVSMVSHEFRTPLTIIRSAAQMIVKFKDRLSGSEKQDNLNRIIVTVDTMTDLLENVLFIGKTESEKFKLNPRPIDMTKFCKGIVHDIKLGLNKERNIRFKSEGEFQTQHIDVKLLRHILFNVLSNALKYSEEEKPIDFNLSCHKDKVIFSIQDYGIGIPEEEQEKIFELFHRAKNVGSVSGTGLGMSVVLQSLKLHGGKIDLSSKVNIGSTFKIEIPSSVSKQVEE